MFSLFSGWKKVAKSPKKHHRVFVCNSACWGEETWLVCKTGMMKEDWNVLKWTNEAKQDEKQEWTSESVERSDRRRVKECREGKMTGEAYSRMDW